MQQKFVYGTGQNQKKWKLRKNKISSKWIDEIIEFSRPQKIKIIALAIIPQCLKNII